MWAQVASCWGSLDLSLCREPFLCNSVSISMSSLWQTYPKQWVLLLSGEGLRQFSVCCQSSSCQLAIFGEPLQGALFSAFSADGVRCLERERKENHFQSKSQNTNQKKAGWNRPYSHCSNFWLPLKSATWSSFARKVLN